MYDRNLGGQGLVNCGEPHFTIQFYVVMLFELLWWTCSDGMAKPLADSKFNKEWRVVAFDLIAQAIRRNTHKHNVDVKLQIQPPS